MFTHPVVSGIGTSSKIQLESINKMTLDTSSLYSAHAHRSNNFPPYLVIQVKALKQIIEPPVYDEAAPNVTRTHHDSLIAVGKRTKPEPQIQSNVACSAQASLKRCRSIWPDPSLDSPIEF